MRGRVLVVALASAFLVGGGSVAVADTVVEVNAFDCELGGDQITVPAGSTIVINVGYGAYTRGVIINFLHAQTTTFSVNGGSPVDVSELFEDPFLNDGLWVSYARYATGITLSAGDSLTWNFVTTLKRLALDVFPFSRTGVHGIRPAFYQRGSQFTFGDCTVTA